ncbi:MAG: signal peptidase I [Ardenticatenia bacterium]|nr:signal peptidase I [Ardenticatenia bacterium]
MPSPHPLPRSLGQRIGTLVRDILEAAVLAVGLFLALQYSLQNTVVEGDSMEPNFVDRQWLLVSKLAYRNHPPERGDVIVFHAPDQPGQDFIKRVVGLPGETVRLQQGRVSIDGRLLPEPWSPRFDSEDFGPYTVPPDSVFVLGDNRRVSNDSRRWEGIGAALANRQIVGEAWLTVWPPELWGSANPVAASAAAP